MIQAFSDIVLPIDLKPDHELPSFLNALLLTIFAST